MTGDFIKIERQAQVPEYLNLNHFINLEEFGGFLKDIEFDLNISIPFPKPLDWLPQQSTIQNIETHNPANKAPENTPDKTELDKILKSVTLTVENDGQINLKLKGKPKQDISATDLGFRDNTTKEWKAFLEILQEGKFNLGFSRVRKTGVLNREYAINPALSIMLEYFFVHYTIQ